MDAGEVLRRVPGLDRSDLDWWERGGYITPQRIMKRWTSRRDYSEKDLRLIEAMHFYHSQRHRPAVAYQKALQQLGLVAPQPSEEVQPSYETPQEPSQPITYKKSIAERVRRLEETVQQLVERQKGNQILGVEQLLPKGIPEEDYDLVNVSYLAFAVPKDKLV